MSGRSVAQSYQSTIIAIYAVSMTHDRLGVTMTNQEVSRRERNLRHRFAAEEVLYAENELEPGDLEQVVHDDALVDVQEPVEVELQYGEVEDVTSMFEPTEELVLSYRHMVRALKNYSPKYKPVISIARFTSNVTTGKELSNLELVQYASVLDGYLRVSWVSRTDEERESLLRRRSEIAGELRRRKLGYDEFVDTPRQYEYTIVDEFRDWLLMKSVRNEEVPRAMGERIEAFIQDRGYEESRQKYLMNYWGER